MKVPNGAPSPNGAGPAGGSDGLRPVRPPAAKCRACAGVGSYTRWGSYGACVYDCKDCGGTGVAPTLTQACRHIWRSGLRCERPATTVLVEHFTAAVQRKPVCAGCGEYLLRGFERRERSSWMRGYFSGVIRVATEELGDWA